MGQKRKASDDGAAIAVHESRRSQVPGSTVAAFKKPHFSRKSELGAVNGIKKRIRDVKRRLEHAPDLPANIKAEDERALGAYEQDLVGAETEKFRTKMIKRYHMVRFFERQKATRQLKKLQKQLIADIPAEEAESLKKQVHVAEVDLNYTQFSPLCDTYIGIFQRQDEVESSIQSAERTKPQMWYIVEKRMAEGTLEELRDRPPLMLASTTKHPRKKRHGAEDVKVDDRPEDKTKTSSQNGKERNTKLKRNSEVSRKRQKQELGSADGFTDESKDGYASGGGFFEE